MVSVSMNGASFGDKATDAPTQPRPRGAFVLLEGVDRCGKTTQCAELVRRLQATGRDVKAMRFPDRTTTSGQLINAYLSNMSEMDDHCIHLLFSQNRWEASNSIRATLNANTTVVCDRYAYSGVAFSAAKPGLSVPWCRAPDSGLPAPDVVIFLDLSPEDARERGGYGEERYEKEEFQRTVRQNFFALRQDDAASGSPPWHVVDARRSVTDIAAEIERVALVAVAAAAEGREVAELWPAATVATAVTAVATPTASAMALVAEDAAARAALSPRGVITGEEEADAEEAAAVVAARTPEWAVPANAALSPAAKALQPTARPAHPSPFGKGSQNEGGGGTTPPSPEGPESPSLQGAGASSASCGRRADGTAGEEEAPTENETEIHRRGPHG